MGSPAGALRRRSGGQSQGAERRRAGRSPLRPLQRSRPDQGDDAAGAKGARDRG